MGVRYNCPGYNSPIGHNIANKILNIPMIIQSAPIWQCHIHWISSPCYWFNTFRITTLLVALVSFQMLKKTCQSIRSSLIVTGGWGLCNITDQWNWTTHNRDSSHKLYFPPPPLVSNVAEVQNHHWSTITEIAKVTNICYGQTRSSLTKHRHIRAMGMFISINTNLHPLPDPHSHLTT